MKVLPAEVLSWKQHESPNTPGNVLVNIEVLVHDVDWKQTSQRDFERAVARAVDPDR